MAATDASPKFQQPKDFRPVPQPPDFHPELVVTTPHDGLHFWQFMVAGSIAGSVEHIAMFPVDTVKTHMQALRSCPIKSVGFRQAVRSIIQTDGPSALYRGIAAMGLGAGPAHAVYFSMYEICKEFFSRGNPNNPAAHAISGVCATIASDAVFTPMDMVKQRLQLGNGMYKGVRDCVKTVLRDEGIGAFYASYRTTVLMNAPFTAVHFATYEAAKRGLMGISPDSADDERLAVHATAGAAAGALAAVVTTPLDVVKTQLQCQGVCGCSRFKSSAIGDVIKTIVEKDGYRGLMRGWIPRMLFHAPAAAICWSTYESSKAFFQKLNDSSNSGTVK
ncbi:putative mitochondrial carrier protein [Tripterygium wilfordii]|uniref:Putative mitochondrial carrier protein n=1 Tax=Tripterygium wilfordii TaxID=458696 RepID=A0A7J7DDL8_TRIWF|nr:mitoferrin-like [Tripterygium wilfordii]KAF5744475.1 putative mitochondrial carrier protein [Tripterygium wilfordii]